MDMWCPYGIGREFWDRVVSRLVDQDPPLREVSRTGVFPFAGVCGSSPIRIIVFVVVEFIIILIINVVGPDDFAELHICKQSGRNHLFFKKPIFA